MKDHPFTDGNKRIGSLLFLLYLRQEGLHHDLNPQALTALTLLIAESAPANKDLLVRLIVDLLAGPGGMNSFTVGALDRELAYERRRVPCDLRIMPHRIQPPRQLLGELIAVEERVSANATAGRLPVLLAPALQQRVRLESSGVAGGRAGSWVQTVSAESRCAAMRWRSFGSRG